MSFQDLSIAAKTYFPKLKIKYKDESWFMKLLGKLLFFNKSFMTSYTTTIGDTIYFPNQKFVKLRPVSAASILLHELVHLYDQKKLTKPIFIFSYLFPQIMVPICLLLFFIITWKIMLPLTLLFLLPIPAIFRMHWEKRAYISSFYTIQALSLKLKFNPSLESQQQVFLDNFKDSSYYFMWPFKNLNKEFEQAITKVQAGQKPFDDSNLFNMIDDLVSKV